MPGVCCDSSEEIVPALCKSSADWCPIDLFCLIIHMATGTRDGPKEWSAKRAYIICVEVIKNNTRAQLTGGSAVL